MLKNKTYKQRFYVFIVFAAFIVMAIYQFSFKKTLNLSNSCALLEQKLDSLQYVPGLIQNIEAELDFLENSMSFIGDRSESFPDYVLRVVALYCSKNSILLAEFPQTHIFTENNIEVVTVQFTVQGNYIKTLQLLYTLESEKSSGRISNVLFFLKKNATTKQPELCMRVMIQNITQIQQQ